MLLEILSKCFPCLPIQNIPVLYINGQSFKILKLLGEGGFSYVYLVESKDGNHYALKKIRCSYGAESIKNAMNEVEAYKEFNSPYILKSIDNSIIEEKNGSKSIYILLPYFENGTLQDLITQNVINGTKLDEKEVLRLFIGISRGLQVMHRHKLTRIKKKLNNFEIESLINDDNEINAQIDVAESDILLESDNEDDDINIDSSILESTEMGETIPYAHRDLKPANVMLSVDRIPVLCDLGSCSKARIQIKTRQQALALQDLAAEHCTLPYRAPELLDVTTGINIDERVDIWSLGCTLYALLYGSSPFERAEAENGASISLAISSGNYEFPKNDDYSEEIKELIKFCLVIDPLKRPSIEQVLSKALGLSL